MNATAAHRDELEKLLEDLSSDRVVSGITFVALVDAYITRLDINCPDISARVSSKAENEALPTNPGPNLDPCSGDREMIVCISPDPGDNARLLDYSV
jgi:hypothetical protein